MARTHAESRTVSIGVLGPLTLSKRGRPIALTSARLRTLLTVLAMSAGHPMSTDRLAADVWGDEQPDHPRRSVQVCVTRLRQLLGAELIETVPGGYVLAVEPDAVDALQFLKIAGSAACTNDIETERAMLVQALALWRGELLEGTPSACRDSVEAVRLMDRRLSVLERRIDLDLAIHRDDDLIDELRDLTARYPFRERFWAQLITALHHTGRRAEATHVYRRLHRRLTEEFGLEPSRPVQEAYRLASDSSWHSRPLDSPVPRQLPADIAYFVGRSGPLTRMDALLSGHVGTTPAVVVLSGAAGVGKTALAVHWAHRTDSSFPDGQLCVNLRGFDPSDSPMHPCDVLRAFLDALGVPAQRVSADPQEQVELYRTLMADKRMLVLLDNARAAEQVRPLLPGAVGCLVLVTSRQRLGELVAENGSHLLSLDALTDREALTVLEARLGGKRLAADPPAVEEVIKRCAGLPLALSMVAARAIIYPKSPLTTREAYLPANRRGVVLINPGDRVE
jgi:DNA-binding SARP family transcriptional activator